MTTKKSRSVAAAVVLGSVSAVSANVGPIPAATPIAGTTLCEVDGWEYAPRWSTPDNGYVSPSLEECAADCEADAVCTGATFIVSGSEKNCWFKNWGTGPVAPPCQPPADSTLVYKAIIDPAGADCAVITYMDETVYSCDEEPEEQPAGVAGVAPTAAVESTVTDPDTLAALMPAYSANPGVDYSPNQVPAPLFSITDVGPGMVVADAVECATACTAEPTCNAASYYGDNPSNLWPGALNCYLKTLAGCELPSDVVTTGDATIFMIGSGECDGVAAAPSAAVPVVGAAAPAGAIAADPTGAIAAAPADGTVGGVDLPTDAAAPLTSEADEVGTDGGSTTGDRAFASAPAAVDAGTSEEAGATEDASASPPTVSETPSSAMGALSGCAATASALVGAVLLL